jgi:lipopolysaccharide/colanic/teichoic acid biosynthesis glycosyltransferase
VQLNDLDEDMTRASVPAGIVPVVVIPGLYRNFLKRVFDLAVVLLSGIVVLPVVAVLALVIMRDGYFPFYLNERVGRGGRTFRMLKLRTMVKGADKLLERHLAANPDALAEWRATQKLKNDPRITPMGRFLRKTSLDELPQLWNVLVGDMSLVGPRPMMPSQRDLYPGLAYYSLLPGMTGPWQVSDRNNCTFAARAEYDRLYDQSLSFGTDLRLILATVRVVLHGTGY